MTASTRATEQFDVFLGQDPTTGHMFFDPVCPPGTQDARLCFATVAIEDNDTLVVTDVEVSFTPTGGYYVATNAITFKVTFNGSVTVTGTPQFAFDIGGNTRQANYTGSSPSTELTFSYTVTTSDADDRDGISWGTSALSLNNGTIKFTSTEVSARVDADLNHPAQSALSAHRVDTQKPSLQDASALGTETHADLQRGTEHDRSRNHRILRDGKPGLAGQTNGRVHRRQGRDADPRRCGGTGVYGDAELHEAGNEPDKGPLRQGG